MKLQFILPVVFFCSTATVFGENFESGVHNIQYDIITHFQDPLQVALFYESYCPDCIQFVEDQLMSVHKVFVNHFQLALLPYGNADQKFVDDHWEFNCQHGPRECLANKLHACAIYQLCGASGTASCMGDKVTQVLSYISCIMKHGDQLQATAQCARRAKLDADTVISCAKGDKGDQLLNWYGNITETSVPWKKGVPTVTINGKHDEAAEDNLMERLCQLRPSLCSPQVFLV